MLTITIDNDLINSRWILNLTIMIKVVIPKKILNPCNPKA